MSSENDVYNNFVIRTEELLKELHAKMIQLEGSPHDREAVDEIFRLVHTIKGNASIFSIIPLKNIAHACEDLLGVVKQTQTVCEKDIVDHIWCGIQLLTRRMSVLRENEKETAQSAEENTFLEECARLVASLKKTPHPHESAQTVRYLLYTSDITAQIGILQAFINQTVWEGKIPVHEQFQEAVEHIARLFEQQGNLDHAGMLNKLLADCSMMIDDTGKPGPLLRSLLTETCGHIMASIKKVEVNVVPANEHVKVQVQKSKASFRIEEEKIDDMIRSVGSLETVKHMFTRIRTELGKEEIARDLLTAFHKGINALDFVIRDLQKSIRTIKKSSPDLLLGTITNLIMALARSCKKKITIKTSGRSIYIERTKLEVLEKILIHVVRNAIDHGIEPPQERMSLGKPEEATICIELYEGDDHIVITVSDDGRGVDFDLLRENAVKKGIIPLEHIHEYVGDKAIELLFLKGVSTARSVNDVSGRGIGMDVVLQSLQQVGGSITVQSQRGKGTSFVLKL